MSNLISPRTELARAWRATDKALTAAREARESGVDVELRASIAAYAWSRTNVPQPPAPARRR